MKKNNIFKKIGVTMLSLIAATTLGIGALTAGNVKAAYDYSTTPKSDAYVAGLFSASEGTTVQSGYITPSYMNPEDPDKSGALITFAGGGVVTTTKTYTVSELANFIRLIPIVNEDKVQLSNSISELQITVYQEGVGRREKAVIYKIGNYSGDGGWQTKDTYGWSGIGAGAEFYANVKYDSDGDGDIDDADESREELQSQDVGGITISGATAAVNAGYGNVPYVRKSPTAARVEVGLAGSKTKTRPYKFGYVQSGTTVQAIAGYQFPNVATKLGDAFKGNSLAGYESANFANMNLIRDLNNTDFIVDKNVDGSSFQALQNETLFTGFPADAQIKLEIKCIGGTGSILVSELFGEDLGSAIRIPNAYNGYVGMQYVMPTAKLHKNGDYAGTAFNGTITVKDAAGNVINDSQKINDTRYNFNNAGTYTATYTQSVTNGSKTENYSSSYTFEILPANAQRVAITLTDKPNDFDKKVGMTFNVGATVSSPVYVGEDLSTIDLVIIKPNGSKEPTITDLQENRNYTFDMDGIYTLKYYAIDAVYTGSVRDDDANVSNNDPLTKETIVTINVDRTYYSLEVPYEGTYSFGDTVNNLVIDRNVVSFFDNAYGRNFFDNASANVSYELEVKAPGETNFVELSNEAKLNGYEFSDKVFGTYEFRFKLSYLYDGDTYTVPYASEGKEWVEFTVDVLDSTAPIIYLVGDDYVSGATFTSKEGNLLRYNALKGSTLTFAKLRAIDTVGVKEDGDYSNEITLALTKDGTVVTGASDAYAANREKYQYNVSEVGEYIFKFDVTDGFNSSYVCIVVEVQNEFYTIANGASFKAEYTTNDVLKVDSFKVLNSKGAEASGVTKKFVVYYNGDEVGKFDSLNYNPSKQGTYVIKLEGTLEGNVVCEESFAFYVEDKTAPTLTINGKIVKKAMVNEEIEIATVIGVDNFDADLDLVNSVSVTLNGAVINTYQGKFTPVEAGVYRVKLTSTDINGNVGTYVYEIQVDAENNEGKVLGVEIWAFVLGVVGVVLIAGAVVVLLLALRKKNPVNVDGDIITVEDDDVE